MTNARRYGYNYSKEPYTVEDPEGKLIYEYLGEIEHVSDTDRSARSRPLLEERRQREGERKPVTPEPYKSPRAHEYIDSLYDRDGPGSARGSVRSDGPDTYPARSSRYDDRLGGPTYSFEPEYRDSDSMPNDNYSQSSRPRNSASYRHRTSRTQGERNDRDDDNVRYGADTFSSTQGPFATRSSRQPSYEPHESMPHYPRRAETFRTQEYRSNHCTSDGPIPVPVRAQTWVLQGGGTYGVYQEYTPSMGGYVGYQSTFISR